MKLNITNVRNYTAYGYVTDDQLTDDQMKTLGLKRDDDYETNIQFEAEIVIDWDDNIPMPYIESLTLYGAYNGKTHLEWKSVSYCDLEWNSNKQGMVTSKSVSVQAKSQYYIDVNVDDIDDLDSIQDDIAEYDNGDWQADHYASKADDYYDSYRDSLMD